MIVDTSALMAVVKSEEGAGLIAITLSSEPGFLPSPALVEFRRVCSRNPLIDRDKADGILRAFMDGALTILPFTQDHAAAAAEANFRYGTGLGVGGTLNLLDLMVYACARVERRPILCTGRDFAATDAAIHRASRV